MKKHITIGEKYSPAMKIKEQNKANKYFKELVKNCMSFGAAREEAEKIERSNLGYYAGYYDEETRLRVEKLFKCSHPIFGKASQKIPSLKEAFEMGLKLGKK